MNLMRRSLAEVTPSDYSGSAQPPANLSYKSFVVISAFT